MQDRIDDEMAIDEIPVIDAGMLAGPIDFERGMRLFQPLTLLLGAALVVVFGIELRTGALADADSLVAVGALSVPHVKNGEVWRLVSCVFLHASIDHLIGNLIILYILGIACEHAFAKVGFASLFLAAGIVGAMFSMAGGRVSVGASDAIFGLAGALIVVFFRFKDELHMRDRRVGVVIAIWAGYQILLGLLSPVVDNFAHVGGLVGGGLCGLLLRPVILAARAKQSDAATFSPMQ